MSYKLKFIQGESKSAEILCAKTTFCTYLLKSPYWSMLRNLIPAYFGCNARGSSSMYLRIPLANSCKMSRSKFYLIALRGRVAVLRHALVKPRTRWAFIFAHFLFPQALLQIVLITPLPNPHKKKKLDPPNLHPQNIA